MKELINKLSTRVEKIHLVVAKLLRITHEHNDVLVSLHERLIKLEDKDDNDTDMVGDVH